MKKLFLMIILIGMKSYCSAPARSLDDLLDVEINYFSKDMDQSNSVSSEISPIKVVSVQLNDEEFIKEVMKNFQKINTEFNRVIVQYVDLSKTIRQLDGEIEKEKQKIKQLNAQVKKLEAEIVGLSESEIIKIRAQIVELLKYRQALFNELIRLSDYKKYLRKQYEELGLQLDQLEAKRDDLAQKIGNFEN